MTIPINYWAVLVAAIVSIVLGFIWYGPLLGKQWARHAGVSLDAMKKPKPSTFVLMIIGSLLTAWILAHALIFANAYLHMKSDASSGIIVGFMNWLGFIGPVTLGPILWEKKSWKLWVINNAYHLISLCLMGIILAVWY
jgi:hypothetical protein